MTLETIGQYIPIVITGILLVALGRKSIIGLATFLIFTTIGYVYFQSLFVHGDWSYRLTLVVETPEGIKTGSAVRKISAQAAPEVLRGFYASHTKLTGEAVVIDLGERGVLFCLMRGNDSVDYGKGIIYRLFRDNKKGTFADSIRYYSNLKAKKEIELDEVPMLVKFRDINDPKTVELVEPNDLKKNFGAGVKLVSATIEMTDDGVTSGVVDKIIPPKSWKEHGYAEWRANLRYDQIIFDWEDFKTGF